MSDRCPSCGQSYAYRVPSQKCRDVNLSRYYRCRHRGRTYLHRIVLNWGGFGATTEVAADVE